VRVDARPAKVDLVEQIGGLPEPLEVFVGGYREGPEFLAECHGNGVLKLRPPHLEHVVQLVGLAPPGHRTPAHRR